MTPITAQSWLEQKLASYPDAKEAVLLLEQNGALAQAAAWPREIQTQASLSNIANQAFRTKQSVSWSGDQAADSIGYTGPNRRKFERSMSLPLVREGKVIGAMAFLLSGQAKPAAAANDQIAERRRSERSADTNAAQLNSNDPPLKVAPSNTPLRKPASAVVSESKAMHILQVVATALSNNKFDEAAAAVATELAQAFECDRVSIGLMNGRFNKIVAVSHSADIQPTPSLLQLLSAAMDEAIDQGDSVQYPALNDRTHQITLSHAELANRHNIQQLLTVAMMRDDTVVGALLFERRDLMPFTEERIELLEHLAATVGPVLELKKNNEYSWFARLRADIARTYKHIFSREGRAMRAVLVFVACALLILPALPMKYSVNAPARLEGVSQRMIVAPADGYLRSVNVRPGDMVKAGQVLAEMADEDLRLERRRWEGEVMRHDGAFGDALKRQDRSQMASAQARAAEARAQLDLAEQQIERTRLVAPFDGVVLKGDLKQQLGAPFKRGDSLLVLAPANEYRVVVSIDDSAIESIAKGARGQILLTAMPDSAMGLVVDRILPVANAHDGRNAFEVEAKLDASVDALRPGMEGVAKLEAGERSVYWMVGHRVTDWLKLSFWTWSR
jgi:Barrel-sandwich domain of CusB or HlyD membrane-fusion/GAF domain